MNNIVNSSRSKHTYTKNLFPLLSVCKTEYLFSSLDIDFILKTSYD